MSAEASVGEIAGALSPKQRAALFAAEEHRWQNAKEIGAHGSVLCSLCWFWPKGADPISPCSCLLSRDYEDAPLRYIYRLTPLGLKIKAHLNRPDAEKEMK